MIGVRPCGTYNTPSAHSKIDLEESSAERVSEKNDRDALTYSERVEAGGSAHDGVMKRTLYNHHDRVIIVQSRVESRQRCVTITGCVHDHNLRDDDKLRDDHKLRVRSQIACVDPNRSKFVT